MTNICSFNEATDSILNQIGGKGASLIKLTKLGLPVPEGYVIGIKASSDEIDTLIAKLSDKYTYAVRSSAINEDGETASFAGQFETITDVKKRDVYKAINDVCNSVNASRVAQYFDNMGFADNTIGIVVQRYVKPEYAGVIFTSDVITGSSRYIVGNYVEGEGEQLVSGSSNGRQWLYDVLARKYTGNEELRKYIKKLVRYSLIIKENYGCPMDIEWAISDGKVFILQARPITTLKRVDDRTFDINGTKSGEYLLTKTNVGEIFMKPVSPMTYSALEKINEFLELPCALDFIKGQAYMNISVICSMQVALGVSEEMAFSNVRDLVGNLPEGMKVPVFPFDKKKFLKNLRKILFSNNKSTLSKKQKSEMVRDLSLICQRMIEHIRTIKTNEDLNSYWNEKLIPSLMDGLSSILAECGTQMVPLFSTRNKITKIAGEDIANRLCGGSVGVLESMKPLLLLEDIVQGKITADDYMKICGHRCVNEMELSEPRPYENPDNLEKLVKEHSDSGLNMYAMLKKQEEEYKVALHEFEELYPSKKNWIYKEINRFIGANKFREEIRGKGVWIFSVLREFLLGIGRVNNICDDVFLLYIDEALDLIKGNTEVLRYIDLRRDNYEKNKLYPAFPGLVCGRFDPDLWIEDENRRLDFYCFGSKLEGSEDIKGFPGAVGKVEGIARVIPDISHIDELKPGEILVTCATNIGWTVAFPKAAAIVTDIGAPLSHAAIVAREFGIPAVVGCGNATTKIRTGQKLVVDGQRGTIIIKN
ncbi:MAG: PEP-utilizing enzyme [Saccharofermentans sp.]|nr:PEP-utilizing enzyme [Saccharofermentans sp.]